WVPSGLVQFFHCAPPCGGVAVELRSSRFDGLLRRTCDLLADTHEACTLLLALRFETRGTRRDSRLRFGDQLLLLVGELSELVGDRALRPFQVVVPRDEPRVHLLLCQRQGFAELVGRAARTFCRGGPALLRDLAFLLREQ